MSIFSSLFRRDSNKHQSADVIPQPFVVTFHNDDTFPAAREVSHGLIFVATLQIRTPLVVLKHHGERYPGPPSAAPQYGSFADGIWTYDFEDSQRAR